MPLNDLRADKAGKTWICISCYSLQHPSLDIKRTDVQAPRQQNIHVVNVQKTQQVFYRELTPQHHLSKVHILQKISFFFAMEARADSL